MTSSSTPNLHTQPSHNKLDDTIDKIKRRIEDVLKPDSRDAPPRTRVVIENELEQARLTNHWDRASILAEELIQLVLRPTAPTSSHKAHNHSLPAHSHAQSQPVISSTASQQETDDALALADCVLAQVALIRFDTMAATHHVDKALANSPHFMDALYLRGILELLKGAPNLSSPRASMSKRSSPRNSMPSSPRNGSGEIVVLNASNPSLPTTTISAIKIPSPTSSPLIAPVQPLVTSNTLSTSADRINAQLALSWFARYRWQDAPHWATHQTRRRTPYRYRLLIELVLARAKLNEMLGNYAESANQYGQVLSLVNGEPSIPTDLQSRVVYSATRLPRMLLYAGQRAESMSYLRHACVNMPTNYAPVMLPALRRAYSSLLLRAFSACEFTPLTAHHIDPAVSPISFAQEALMLLLQSGSHCIVATPAQPPSLHWHPFSPISTSHGSSSHAIYLSHSPVPLPVTAQTASQPNMRTILSIDYSTIHSEDREAHERETCLSLARGREYIVLAEMYRTLLCTQLESPQLWYKLAIALVSSKQYNEAYLAITECLNRAPDYAMALLMAGKLCLNYLDKPKEAVTYAARALEIAEQSVPVVPRSSPSPIASLRASYSQPIPSFSRVPSQSVQGSPRSVPTSPRSISHSGSKQKLNQSKTAAMSHPPTLHYSMSPINHMTLTSSIHASLLLSCQILYGIACSKYAYVVTTFSNRKALQKRALTVLQAAYKSSPHHHRVLFALACLYADIREIGMALALLKQCLVIDRTHVDSWNLLALLLSAQKKPDEAIRACDDAIKQRQSSQGAQAILLTRSRLYAHTGQYEDACRSYVELVTLLFSSNEFTLVEAIKGRGRRPVFRTNKPAAQTRPHAGSGEIVLNIDDPTLIRCETLLSLSQLYAQHYAVTNDATFLKDAAECVASCEHIAPASLQSSIHAQRARLTLLNQQPQQALHHFESGLAIDSTHTPSLIGLASIYSSSSTSPQVSASSNLVLAYGLLTQALQIDATDHSAWHAMGVVLVNQNRGEEAVDQFIAAAELERSAPLVSFSTIARRV